MKQSKLRLILGSNLDDFNQKDITNNKSYEVIFNSEDGILIKNIQTNIENSKNIDNKYNKEDNIDNKVNTDIKDKEDNTNNIDIDDIIQFYDTDIHQLFQDSINIEIIFLDNILYINTNNNKDNQDNKDTRDSSIKLRFKLPNNTTIKYIAIDPNTSFNLSLNEIRLINTVEQTYLINVFEFNKRLMLKKDNYFEQEMWEGDFCIGIGKKRKTIVRYECDSTGMNDMKVRKYNNSVIC